MSKNLYFRDQIHRKGIFMDWFLSFFYTFASPTRELLEVFIRKDFGERYFRFGSVLTLAGLLAIWPLIPALFWNYEALSLLGFISKYYLTWYAYLAAFVMFGYRHHQDMKHGPSVYNFERYSKCSGTIHPFFFNENLFGKVQTRTIETCLEPAPFLALGILLSLFGQPLGYLLIFCSICYSLSYVAAWRSGDNFIMDMIDEMICNEELTKVFMNDADKSQTRGFAAPGRKPADPELRRKLLGKMLQTDEVVEAS